MTSSTRKKKLLIFLSHANEDKPTIRKLCKRLKDEGFDPWLDEERILPGQDWNLEIEIALRKSDTVLVSFSKKSLVKEGYIQREYKKALDYQKEKPEGTVFVIPVRLDDCEIPFILRELQYVDYPLGYERLVMSLNVRAGRSKSTLKPQKDQTISLGITKADRLKEDFRQVQLVLEGDFEGFNETRQEDLVSVLASMLRVDSESIHILQVYSGSIIVVAELSRIAADRLSEFARNADFRLKAEGILSIQIESEQPILVSDTANVDQKKLQVSPSLSKLGTSVFVSYAWGGESESIVDELEQAFVERGIHIVRDKKDTSYKGSMEPLKQRISQGQNIVLVIGDKYLRSEDCMYELAEVYKHRNLHNRVFPIVLEDAQIYKAIDRSRYIEYWDDQIEQLNQAIKKVDVVKNLAGIVADLDKYASIRDSFDHLTEFLNNMNALTPETHVSNGFSTLVSTVEHAMVENKTFSIRSDSVALPSEVSKNQSEQLQKLEQDINELIAQRDFSTAKRLLQAIESLGAEGQQVAQRLKGRLDA